MLARLWRRTEVGVSTPQTAAPTAVPDRHPQPPSATHAPNRRPQPTSATDVSNPRPPLTSPTTVPKSRPRSVVVARLYPRAKPEPARHAEALLKHIQQECPEYAGRYIPRADLEGTYRELCAANGWEARHWTAIARRLGRMTSKKELKREGERFIAYRIPKPR